MSRIAIFDTSVEVFRHIQSAGGATGFYTQHNVLEFLNYVREEGPPAIFISSDIKVAAAGMELDSHFVLRKAVGILNELKQEAIVFIRVDNPTDLVVQGEFEKDLGGSDMVSLMLWKYEGGK